MSLLNNFVNPWAAATGVLDTGVLDSSVLATDVLENITLDQVFPSLIYSEEGVFLGEVAQNEKQGEIFIMNEDVYDGFTKKNTKAISYQKVVELAGYGKDVATGRVICGKYLDVVGGKAKVVSKILTHIMQKWGFDTSKLVGGEISVLALPISAKDYKHNDPNPGVNFANTVHEGKYFRVSANIKTMADYLPFVANIVSALGVHEFTGHGVNKWGDKTLTHYKAYELQFKHFSWKNTTDYYKAYMVYNYLDYLKSEKGNTYFKEKFNKFKQQYGKNPDFDYVWSAEY